MLLDRLMRGDIEERLARWSVVVPCLPIIVMAVRKFSGDWQPLGDAAYFAVRSRDVLTANHPLLGAWSSGSAVLEESVNNLGPLQLDLLAPFTRLLGSEGLAIGIGLLNVAAVVGVWAVCRRLIGPVAVVAVMGVTALLEWTMGSRALIEGRQQWALMLPFWCLLFVSWAVSAGRAWALPWLVFVASLIVQTHLTFALPTGIVALAALAGFVVTRWTLGDAGGGAAPRVRPMLVAAAVGVVCWAQPLWDQFFGTGNLGRALGAPSEAAGIGGTRGARVLTDILGQPPYWLADSITRFGSQRAAHERVVGLAAAGDPGGRRHRRRGAGSSPAVHHSPHRSCHLGTGAARQRLVGGVHDPVHEVRCGAAELSVDLAGRRLRHAVGGITTRRGAGETGGDPAPGAVECCGRWSRARRAAERDDRAPGNWVQRRGRRGRGRR